MMKEQLLRIVSTCLVLLVLSLTFASAVHATEIEGDREDVPDMALPDNFNEDARNEGSELPVNVLWVKINDDEVPNGATIREKVERGEELDIKVKIMAVQDTSDLGIQAWISGDDDFILSDYAENIRDLDAGTLDTIKLKLKLPEIMETDKSGHYKLRILLADRDGALKAYNYNFVVENPSNAIVVRDVFFSPNSQVQAGRALLTVVRLENLGEEDEDNVRVTVEIPDLNVAATDYIDEVEVDDEVSSEELYMRIPADAKPGVYDVVVTVDFDERAKDAKQVHQIQVLAGTMPSDDEESGAGKEGGKTIVTIGPETQDAAQGADKGAVYPVTLTNEGKTSKTYTIAVGGVEAFGSVQVSPSNVVVVNPSETKTVYIYLTMRSDATLGTHTFSVEIKSGDKSLQSVPLSVNVVGASDADWSSVKRGLEVGLVVLIVLLVILGVVIAVMKAKKKDDEGSEQPAAEQTTYY
ncbi:hypothetical protein HYU19_03620 [Candidatus Woesearchaeota archaeon]|nr:hypothetical protein [Candidatus Woesearchaeota archaeon]